jgi:hypothetical protein
MHVVVLRVQVSEVLWTPPLPRMMQTIHTDIILLRKPLRQLLRQGLKRTPRIRELSISARIRWRQHSSAQQRVARPSRIEGAVNVEEGVAAAVVVARTVNSENIAFAVNIASIKELIEVVARLAATGHVRAYVVEVAEAANRKSVSTCFDRTPVGS